MVWNFVKSKLQSFASERIEGFKRAFTCYFSKKYKDDKFRHDYMAAYAFEQFILHGHKALHEDIVARLSLKPEERYKHLRDRANYFFSCADTIDFETLDIKAVAGFYASDEGIAISRENRYLQEAIKKLMTIPMHPEFENFKEEGAEYCRHIRHEQHKYMIAKLWKNWQEDTVELEEFKEFIADWNEFRTYSNEFHAYIGNLDEEERFALKDFMRELLKEEEVCENSFEVGENNNETLTPALSLLKKGEGVADNLSLEGEVVMRSFTGEGEELNKACHSAVKRNDGYAVRPLILNPSPTRGEGLDHPATIVAPLLDKDGSYKVNSHPVKLTPL